MYPHTTGVLRILLGAVTIIVAFLLVSCPVPVVPTPDDGGGSGQAPNNEHSFRDLRFIQYDSPSIDYALVHSESGQIFAFHTQETKLSLLSRLKPYSDT